VAVEFQVWCGLAGEFRGTYFTGRRDSAIISPFNHRFKIYSVVHDCPTKSCLGLGFGGDLIYSL